MENFNLKLKEAEILGFEVFKYLLSCLFGTLYISLFKKRCKEAFFLFKNKNINEEIKTLI